MYFMGEYCCRLADLSNSKSPLSQKEAGAHWEASSSVDLGRLHISTSFLDTLLVHYLTFFLY